MNGFTYHMFVRRVKTWWQRNGDVVCFLLSLFAFRQLIPVSGRDGLHRAYIRNEAVVCAAEGSSVEKTDDKINDRPYDSDLAVFLLLELGEFLVRQRSGMPGSSCPEKQQKIKENVYSSGNKQYNSLTGRFRRRGK